MRGDGEGDTDAAPLRSNDDEAARTDLRERRAAPSPLVSMAADERRVRLSAHFATAGDRDPDGAPAP